MPLKGKLFENPEEAVLFPSKRKDSRTVPYLGRREKKTMWSMQAMLSSTPCC